MASALISILMFLKEIPFGFVFVQPRCLVEEIAATARPGITSLLLRSTSQGRKLVSLQPEEDGDTGL